MKKLLIGLAAGALAFTAAAGSVSASTLPGTSVYDIMKNAGGSSAIPGFESYNAKLLLDASGLASTLDKCNNAGDGSNGLPQYTVFFPASYDASLQLPGYSYYDGVIDKLLVGLDVTEGELYTQGALIATVLKYHVIPQNISPDQMASPTNTVFMTMGGLQLVKTGSYYINGYYFDIEGTEACNGWVYELEGLLVPISAIQTIGLTADGSATQAAGAATGEGLPATGSESLALTYAALASLIAGAGVLVIRRRSVA